MPAVYEYTREVQPKEIDPLGHANNIVYLQWMQDAALAHTSAQGWPAKRYADLGCGWVVRTHRIEYLKPAFVEQIIVVRTWVALMKRVSSTRHYHIMRASDDTLLAVAETEWAFVSYQTGLPTRIPTEVSSAFEIHQPS